MLLVNAAASRAAELSDSVFLTFFDVGQGDALLIHQPNRCAVLIDTGAPGSGQNIGAFLAKKGISRLDRLIISHPHDDHFAGTLSLPPDLTIAQVNDNGVTNSREKSFQAYQNWRARHLYHPLKKGDVWRCGQIIFTVLGPDQARLTTGNINDTSLVLRVEAGPVSLLLPGDIEATGWQSLNASAEQLASDIFKVPHHGAQDRYLDNWLKVINPELSVVSVGSDNHIGAPDRNTLEAIRQESGRIWRTDQQGDLEIRIDRQGWHYVNP